MGIEQPPIRSNLADKDGYITRPWRDWFQFLADAINNTETITVVTQAVPELTEEITYIDGAE